MRMRSGSLSLILLFAAGCSQAPERPPTPQPSTRERPTPQLPHRRHGHRVERVDGGLLCVGGFRPSRTADRGQRESFFLADGEARWRPIAATHHPHAFCGSAVIDGHAHVVGEAVERYDADGDRWQVLVAPGLLPRSHFGCAAVGEQLFVLGGFPELDTGFHVVDARTGEVTAAAPPPSFAHGDHLSILVTLQGELHVLGGINGAVDELQRRHWVRRDGAWRALADCPTGVWSKFAAWAVCGGRLYAFGDFGGLCYEPSTDSWSRRANMPSMRAMPAAVVGGGEIHVIGGMPVEGDGGATLRYDVAADRWR